MVYEGRRRGSGYTARRRGTKKGRGSAAGTLFSVCLWIFFLAVAVRLAWPEAADKVGARVAALFGNPDIGGAVEVLGRGISGGDGIAASFRAAWEYAFRADDGGDVRVNGDVDGDDLPASDGNGAALPAMGDDTGNPVDQVEAFKLSQSEFEEYGIPANATFDKPEVAEMLITPVAGTVTSGFGYRVHPSDNKVRFHYGLDIGAREGSEVGAAADGTVMAVGDSTSYGLYVILEHEDGLKSLYAHLGEISVRDGEAVTAGGTVGLVGSTGNATGACLHFELIVGGNYVNPAYYLNL